MRCPKWLPCPFDLFPGWVGGGGGGGERGGAIAMICTWHAEDEEEGRQGYENHLKELKACVHQHIFRILILYPFQPL